MGTRWDNKNPVGMFKCQQFLLFDAVVLFTFRLSIISLRNRELVPLLLSVFSFYLCALVCVVFSNVSSS